MKKFYIGFDLGDGETSAFYVLYDIESEEHIIADALDLPGGGRKPIPTLYGIDKETDKVVLAHVLLSDAESVKDIEINFKRRPSDLLDGISDIERNKLIAQLNMENVEWGSIRQVNHPALVEYKQHVVNFVNAIFEDEGFINDIQSGAQDGEEIVVVVGHPTKWDSLDRGIYHMILKESILGGEQFAGKPLKLLEAPESRAAFLTMRNKALDLKQGITLLVDIGSSTVDLTALQGGDSRMTVYNSGHNYLGARNIDFLIYELFLQKIEEKGALEQYNQILKLNPDYRNYIVMLCRKVKESVYGDGGVKQGKITVDVGEYDAFKIIILKDEIDRILNKPMRTVMEKYNLVSAQELERIGEESYLGEVKMFLSEEKAELVRQNLEPTQVIITGSASRVPAVREVVKDIFGNSRVVADLRPDEAIALGLVYAGISDEKSAAFQKEVEKMLKEQTPAVVERHLESLAGDLSEEILKLVVDDQVIPELKKWRTGAYVTLRDAIKKIEKNCNEDYITTSIQHDTGCLSTISEWMTQKVGKDMGNELMNVCRRYGIHAQELENIDTNIIGGLNGINLNMSNVGNKMASGIMDSVTTIASVIAGVIACSSSAAILGAIITIISLISINVAVSIAVFLIFNPITVPIAAALFGIAAVTGIKTGNKKIKGWMNEKVLDANLPLVARKLMTDKKLNEILERDMPFNIVSMKKSIMNEGNKGLLKEQIASTYSEAVRELIDKIKYIVESK